jgi:DNA-binding transcriptional regulator YiaG
MFCPNCDVELIEILGQHHFTECGLDNVWLRDWKMLECKTCNYRIPVLPDAMLIAQLLTEKMVVIGSRLNGDGVRFLRKNMHLASEALAQMLGTTRVEISRWENGANEISPFYDFKLRLIAIDRLVPVDRRSVLFLELCRIVRTVYNPDVILPEGIRVSGAEMNTFESRQPMPMAIV